MDECGVKGGRRGWWEGGGGRGVYGGMVGGSLGRERGKDVRRRSRRHRLGRRWALRGRFRRLRRLFRRVRYCRLLRRRDELAIGTVRWVVEEKEAWISEGIFTAAAVGDYRIRRHIEDFDSGLLVGVSVYWTGVSDMYGFVRGGLQENEYLENQSLFRLLSEGWVGVQALKSLIGFSSSSSALAEAMTSGRGEWSVMM